MVSRVSKIIWYNTKILFDLNAAAAILLVALAPFIFSFDLLAYKDIAKVSELYFSILGIILFAYIGNIENQEQAVELVSVRTLPHFVICFIRLMMVLLLAFALVSAILLYAKLRGSIFPFGELSLGVMVTILFLGAIAYTLTNLTNQVSTAYIAAFAYYLMEYSTKGKYTGEFYLFSLTKLDIAPKYYLLGAAAAILILNLLYIHYLKPKQNHITTT